MQFANDIKLDFGDVLIVPKTSSLDSRQKVDIERKLVLPHCDWDWKGVPIIAANMDTVGTLDMADALSKHNMLTAMHKHHDFVALTMALTDHPMNTFYSMGITAKDFQRLDDFIAFNKERPKMVCVDVANGYTTQFLDAVKAVRHYCPNSMIMAGNVVTPEKTEQVIEAGADCVKIGIGPGSVCTTRIKTGVGYPQLSAIIECADAAHGIGGLVCGDGGITCPGDMAKAFGAGADFVMIGGLFAGTDESGGELIHINHAGDFVPYDPSHKHVFPPSHVKFYGMSSRTANEKYSGKLADYKAAEGKEVLVPYKGPVDEVIQDLLGGLRSTMTYVGAKKLKELTKRTKFIRVNNQYNKMYS